MMPQFIDLHLFPPESAAPSRTYDVREGARGTRAAVGGQRKRTEPSPRNGLR